jgi:hypothetical protein
MKKLHDPEPRRKHLSFIIKCIANKEKIQLQCAIIKEEQT